MEYGISIYFIFLAVITDEDIKNGKTSETRSEHSDRP